MDRREFVLRGIAAFGGLGAAALTACGGDGGGVTDPGGGGGDGGGGGGGGGTDPLTVEANDSLVFSPRTLEIEVGETVTWENVGNVAHTVTPDGHSQFSDTVIDGGETFQHTFDEVGEFPYICRFHSGMDGTISVVQASS